MWYENILNYDRLWLEGNSNLIDNFENICIAGSRNPPKENGLKEAQKIGEYFGGKENTVLVSGLARGVDIISLKGFAIGKKGRKPFCIGCIGTAPDKVYPRENKPVQDLIKKEHLLISLVKPNENTSKYHFLERNRLMARLSSSIYILSCSETSGCHTLLDEALKLQKFVFVDESNKNLSWVVKLNKKYNNRIVFSDFSELLV